MVIVQVSSLYYSVSVLTHGYYRIKIRGEVIRGTNCFNLKRNIVALTPTSNIVTQQNFVLVTSWSSMLQQVELTICFNLQRQHFVAWQCSRWVVIRATTLLTLKFGNYCCWPWLQCVCRVQSACGPISVYRSQYRFFFFSNNARAGWLANVYDISWRKRVNCNI